MRGGGLVFFYHQFVDLGRELPVDQLQSVTGLIFADVCDVRRSVALLGRRFIFIEALSVERGMKADFGSRIRQDDDLAVDGLFSGKRQKMQIIISFQG